MIQALFNELTRTHAKILSTVESFSNLSWLLCYEYNKVDLLKESKPKANKTDKNLTQS